MRNDQTSALPATSARSLSTRDVIRKLLRFALSGAVATALYFVLATLAVRFGGIRPVTASCIAYVICIIVSYFLQSRLTFGVRNDTTHQIAKFISVSLVGMIIATLVMQVAVNIYGLPYWAGAAFVSGIIPIGNFIVFSIWVFVER
jgi:putative flippase GtrA